MKLIDVIGEFGHRRAPRSGDRLVDALIAELGPGGAIGSVSGLVGRFTHGGFGRQANSWVGTGPNEAITPADVEAAVGRRLVDDLSRRTALPRAEVRDGLARIIPALVDSASPKGCLPTGNVARSMKGVDFASILTR